MTQAKSALNNGQGEQLSLIETTAGGLGAGAVNAPRRDYEQKRASAAMCQPLTWHCGTARRYSFTKPMVYHQGCAGILRWECD